MTTEQLKQAILDRIDYLAFFRERLEGFRHNGGAEATARCPFHDDQRPSFSVNVGDRSKHGTFHC